MGYQRKAHTRRTRSGKLVTVRASFVGSPNRSPSLLPPAPGAPKLGSLYKRGSSTVEIVRVSGRDLKYVLRQGKVGSSTLDGPHDLTVPEFQNLVDTGQWKPVKRKKR